MGYPLYMRLAGWDVGVPAGVGVPSEGQAVDKEKQVGAGHVDVCVCKETPETDLSGNFWSMEGGMTL